MARIDRNARPTKLTPADHIRRRRALDPRATLPLRIVAWRAALTIGALLILAEILK